MSTTLVRVVHPHTRSAFRPIREIAPDIKPDPAEGEVFGLAFQDDGPNGDIHIFLFNEEKREDLVKKLTGGIVIAGAVPH